MQIEATCEDCGLKFMAEEHEIELANEDGWHCPSCCGDEDVTVLRDWECMNCGTKDRCSEDRLPVGWRWIGLAEGIDGIHQEVESPLICSFCVARVEKALEESKICGGK